MRVLQINAVNGIKSTGRTTLELAEYLNSHGHEAYIAYSTGDYYYNSYKIGTIFEKKVHSLLNRVIGKQEYYSSFSTKRLIKYIKKINPDIIHLRNLHASYINMKVLFEFFIKEKKRVVITLHDCWFYTGKCTHYTLDNCYEWQNSCGNCPRLKKDIPSLFFDWTPKMLKDKESWFNKLDQLAVIGVSDWITDQARLSILSNARIMKRIYNWINLDIFKPVEGENVKKKYSIEGEFMILGVASIWTNTKGLNHFINLSKNLSQDEVIVLVGNIDENIKLPSNIINIKETHNQYELAALYSSADVFLNLSFEETFGKTTAESISCGTPAIVNNSTANPEIIGKGCGYIIDNLNNKSILNAINLVKINGKNKYRKECLDFSRKYFDKETNINKQIDVYKNLME